ncbi:MAG: hypothetical protein MUC36_14185 [Planctomycetes bacterium]|nr:hypothetical protein [Planctomycetota bacterium]
MPIRPLRHVGAAILRCALASCTLLLAADLVAQQRSAAPRLVPSGRCFARGDGVATRCLITADSARALTIGADQDLVWWNLRERKPLRHIDPPDAPVHSVLLHPSEPLLLEVRGDGTGQRVDLESGERLALDQQQFAALEAAATREWLTGGLPGAPDADVVAANGAHRLVRENGFWRRAGAIGHFFSGGPHWLADDGTVVSAKGAKVQLQGLRLGDRADASVHCATPQRVVFTPDGNCIAVVSLAALQIFDRSGNEIASLAGTHLVQPGPGPDEFWLIDADGRQRWSATGRAFVGERITWPGRHLHLVDDRAVERLEPRENRVRLRPVMVRAGQLWTPEAALLPDGTLRALKPPPPPAPKPEMGPFGPDVYEQLGPSEAALAFAAASSEAAPMLLTSAPGDSKFTRARATLRRLGDDGATTHHVRLEPSARWLLLAANGAQVVVGLADGTVHLFDSERLSPLAKVTFRRPLVAAAALGADHLLASCGDDLLRLAAGTLEVVDRLPMPEGLDRVDQLAISADGKRLAIVRGSAVSIMRLE